MSYLPGAIRNRVTLRDGGRCHYCGIVTVDAGEPDRALREFPGLSDDLLAWLRSRIGEVDHVVPRSEGGTDALRNLVLACRRCNQRKGAKPHGQFAMTDHWSGRGEVAISTDIFRLIGRSYPQPTFPQVLPTISTPGKGR